MKKLRDLLTDNKIYFETIAAATLVGASVFVSVLQWKTSERQTEIARREITPYFALSTKLVQRPGEATYSDEYLTVENFGGNAREANLTNAVWLLVDYAQAGKHYQFRLPINGYYFGTETRSGSVKGVMFVSSGDRNNEKIHKLVTAVRDLARKKECTVNIEVLRYTLLTYRDVLGDEHAEYFLVKPVHGSFAVRDETGKKWIEEWPRSEFLMDIDTLTAEGLFDIAAKKIANYQPPPDSPNLPSLMR